MRIVTVIMALLSAPLSAEPAFQCAGDRAATPQEVLLACFRQALLGDADDANDQAYLRMITPHWNGLDAEARSAAVGRYREGLAARAAVAVGITPRTPDLVAILHAQAFETGRAKWSQGMLARAPVFTAGRGKDFSELDQRRRASHYYDDTLADFLKGNDNDSLGELVRYAPSFVAYLAAFPDDFPLAEKLRVELQIAEENAHQAELDEMIAGLSARNAELRKPVRLLQMGTE